MEVVLMSGCLVGLCRPAARPALSLLAIVGVLQFRTPARADCLGDCNETGMVEVVDLVTGLRIALGDDPLAVCTAWDANGDGDVTIDELMLGVGEALNGCPPAISEPPRCGDHLITGQEQCDDGNTVGGDGCSASCTVEGPGPVDQIWNGCIGSGGGININYAAPVGQEFVPDGATLSGVAVRVTTQFADPAGSANLTARIHTATID